MELDLISAKNRKLGFPYPVKTSSMPLQVKEVDLKKRTVQFIANTYYYFDKDQDVLVNGCATKSIQERGPSSAAVAKIKHLADHRQLTGDMVGKPTLIQEKVMETHNVLYYESKIPPTTEGDDHLIKYQEGIYDNHSIGFRYLQIGLAEMDSEDEDRVKRWNEYYPLIINKEEALAVGYFYLVKEIDLFEASVVTFGANNLSGVVGTKGASKETQILELNKRMDLLQKQLRVGTVSDNSMRDFEMQIAQIKQIQSEVMNAEPDVKDTLKKPSVKSTPKKLNFDTIIKGIN